MIEESNFAGARGEVARLLVQRRQTQDQLELLASGLRDLQEHIKKLDGVRSAANAEAHTSAEGLLDKIRRGQAWNIVASKPANDYTGELKIARAALKRLETDIAEKENLLEGLGSRVRATARQAVLESMAKRLPRPTRPRWPPCATKWRNSKAFR
jgi:uncharacterized coiled-coil protein SlyX